MIEVEFFQGIQQGVIDTTWVEWVAVLCAILYLIFLAQKKIICWFFAFLSSVLYTKLCIDAQLYLESFLQLFYIIMAIWGWFSWKNGSKDRPITKWKFKYHFLNITICSMLAIALGMYFSAFTDQSYPFLDATTTVFSLTVTFLVIYRVLSNWIYWIVIDSLGMVLFYLKGFELTVLLYLLYTVLAVFGYLKWLKMYKKQSLT